MSRKSVAVLDIRSAEVSVFVGERGVNHTFVFNASKTEPYDGYQDGAFYSVERLSEAVFRALAAVEQICGERIKRLYVGVPGEFTKVIPREQDLGFPQRRKIGQREIDALFESGKKKEAGYQCIRVTSMIYTTADNRRVVDPIGLNSTGLSGVLSYFYCSDYFIQVIEEMFKSRKTELYFLPTQFAMAAYLIPSETRDEYALFLDVGHLSSTVCVLLGNGVLAQSTYWVGRGQIAVLLMQKFQLPSDAALALLARSNLYATSAASTLEFEFRGESFEISIKELIETIKEGLNGICECVSGFLEDVAGRELDRKPIYVTGEGICDIRGALEHVTKQLNYVCEQVVPDLPYYNKPAMSSRVALLDMAYEDNRKHSAFFRFINAFGG